MGITLVAWAFIENVGPGLGALCLIGGASLLFVAPLMQVILLCTPTFRGQHGVVCAVAIISILAVLFGAALSGAFTFW
jgi:hypothetical protein